MHQHGSKGSLLLQSRLPLLYTTYHQLLYNYSLQEPHKKASFYSFLIKLRKPSLLLITNWHQRVKK